MRSAEKALQAPKSGKIHLLLLGQGKFPGEGTKGSVWCLPSAFAELEFLGKRQSCGNGAGTGKGSEEFQKFVILTCSEPTTIQP